MHKALHPKDDMKRYVPRKEIGWGHPNIEDMADASMRGLKDYTKKERRKTHYSEEKQHKQHKDFFKNQYLGCRNGK